MADQLKRVNENAANAIATQRTDNEDRADTIDFTELLYHLLARWKSIVCSALVLAILIGAYTIFFITPMYSATSSIYVLNRKDSAINLSDVQIGTALTQDYVKLFSTHEVHEEVIETLGLKYTTRQISKMLKVTNDNGTRVLDITVTSPSPKEAKEIADTYSVVARSRIAKVMDMDEPTVLSDALLPTSPVSPNRTRNILIGFVLGAFIAIAFYTVRFLMDDKYKTADDIRKYTGLNTLAILPDENMDSKERKATRGSRREL